MRTRARAWCCGCDALRLGVRRPYARGVSPHFQLSASVVLFVPGIVLHVTAIPINKNLYRCRASSGGYGRACAPPLFRCSVSYILVMGALGGVLISCFYYLIDVLGPSTLSGAYFQRTPHVASTSSGDAVARSPVGRVADVVLRPMTAVGMNAIAIYAGDGVAARMISWFYWSTPVQRAWE